MIEQSTSAPEYKESPIDQLTTKTGQLHAMLATIYGSGFETFNLYNDTIKQNYLWACADLAKEIDVLAGQITP